MRISIALLGLSSIAVSHQQPPIASDADTPLSTLASGHGRQEIRGDMSDSGYYHEKEQSKPKEGSVADGRRDATIPPTNTTVLIPRATINQHQTAPPTSVTEKTSPNPANPETKTNMPVGGISRIQPPTNITNTTKTITMKPPAPTRTSKSLIPHWSYRKSSIAAASIFSAVALIAVIFLAVMYIRRLRWSWKQRQIEKANRKNAAAYSSTRTSYSAIPMSEDSIVTEPKFANAGAADDEWGKGDREELMFSRTCSPSKSPVVEQSSGLRRGSNIGSHSNYSTVSVDRVESVTPAPETISPIRSSSSDKTKATAAPVNLATLDRQYDPHLLSSQRRESLAKSIVVVRPPATTAVPMSARTASVADEQVASHDPHVLSRANTQPQTQSQYRDYGRDATASRSEESVRVARLPSIKRSQSPIFKFEDV